MTIYECASAAFANGNMSKNYNFYCMTSLSYGRAFCLESQKIDGTYQRYNHYF